MGKLVGWMRDCRLRSAGTVYSEVQVSRLEGGEMFGGYYLYYRNCYLVYYLNSTTDVNLLSTRKASWAYIRLGWWRDLIYLLYDRQFVVLGFFAISNYRVNRRIQLTLRPIHQCLPTFLPIERPPCSQSFFRVVLNSVVLLITELLFSTLTS